MFYNQNLAHVCCVFKRTSLLGQVESAGDTTSALHLYVTAALEMVWQLTIYYILYRRLCSALSFRVHCQTLFSCYPSCLLERVRAELCSTSRGYRLGLDFVHIRRGSAILQAPVMVQPPMALKTEDNYEDVPVAHMSLDAANEEVTTPQG